MYAIKSKYARKRTENLFPNILMTPARDPSQGFCKQARRSMEEKSMTRNHGGIVGRGIIEKNSLRGNHCGGIIGRRLIEKKPFRRNHG
jgi:hypothetical protein